jgi:hypothetical protein
MLEIQNLQTIEGSLVYSLRECETALSGLKNNEDIVDLFNSPIPTRYKAFNDQSGTSYIEYLKQITINTQQLISAYY